MEYINKMAYERYRIWLKNGKYEVAVARNRVEAVGKAISEKSVVESQIEFVGKATSRGKLFKYPF